MADVSVRPSRVDDGAALAAVQVAAWRASYAGRLPAAVVEAFAAQEAEFAAAWAEAAVRPPSPVHRVLVACDGPAVVAGASLGPAEDEDQDPNSAGEIYTFVVDPAHRAQGHGTRLLTAAVDFLRGGGFSVGHVWLDEDDAAGQGLFAASGWAADGSVRTLDLAGDGAAVLGQVRLHTDLREVA
jgi:ribosomal protein S18 acetylase RimI-like enzyme